MSTAEDFGHGFTSEAFPGVPEIQPPILTIVPDIEAAHRIPNPRARTQAGGNVPHNTFDLYKDQLGREPLLSAQQEVELARTIEAGLYAGRIAALATTRDRGTELDRIWDEVSESNDGDDDATYRFITKMVDRAAVAQSDPEVLQDYQAVAAEGKRAMDRFVAANGRYVIGLAAMFNEKHMSFKDMVQEGNIGLIEAVMKFDYTKGFKFSTFAKLPIRQNIIRALADRGRLIRIPRNDYASAHSVERTIARLEDEGVRPTDEAVATELEMPQAKVAVNRAYPRVVASLDRPLGDHGSTDPEELTLLDVVSRRTADDAYAESIQAQMPAHLYDTIALLDKAQMEFIKLRYGLDGYPKLPLAQIGLHIGVPRHKMAAFERETMAELRRLAEDAELGAYLV